ncbi:hypothetical protein GCM10028784_20050 [Myceligenerans cantabricum]
MFAAAALLLCVLLPATLVRILARVGVLESKWVRPRVRRAVALAGVVVVELAAIAVLAWLGAPPRLLTFLGAWLVGVASLAAITPWIRASIHTGTMSVIAGVMTQVDLVLAGALLLGSAVVGASRLVQREHTPVEVITGFA